MLFAVATSLGLNRLLQGRSFQHGFGYAGVIVCFVLAAFSLGAAWRAYKHGVPETDPKQSNDAKTLIGDFATGFGMTALNVYTWIWWFVTVPALAAQRGTSPATDLPITCIGVAIAASGWVVVFTTIINAVRRFAGRAWHVGADLAGGILLLGFGFWALWRLLDRPL